MSQFTEIKTYVLNNGKEIPKIGLGVYDIPQNKTAQITYEALNKGYTHFDTAEYYDNEEEVGEGIAKWLKQSPQNKREKVFYVTKVFSPDGYNATKTTVEEMLAKVKDIDYIDLVLVHSPLSNKKNRLRTWEALQDAVFEGKVKSIGVSNYGIHHIQELLNWEGLKIKPVVNQIELHPWLMRTSLVEFCKKNEIILEAYCPLTHGMKLKDPTLLEISNKYKKSPAQILIKWSLQQGFVVLPKSSNIERLSENLNVFDFEITPKDIDILSHPDAYERFGDWDPTNYTG